MDIAKDSRGWTFGLLWVLATTLGTMAGFGVGKVLQNAIWRGLPGDWVVCMVFAGTSIGLLQSLVLGREVSGPGWWVLASTVGLPMGVALGGAAGSALEAPAVEAFLVAPSIGAMQWLFLRQRVSRAGWWILASMLGWGGGAASAEVLSRLIGGSRVFVLSGVLGLVVGVVTGMALVWLLKAPVALTVEDRVGVVVEAGWTLKNFARLVAIGTFAGLIAGLTAGGLGARLAMRISAVAAGPAMQGKITAAENVVGRVTAGNTAFVVVVGGMVGILGGLLYMGLRRWLPGTGAGKGLMYGLVLLLMAGSAVIQGTNPDFGRLGSPALNISIFASLFILFGMIVAPLAERLDRSFPVPSWRFTSLVAYAVALVILCPMAKDAVDFALASRSEISQIKEFNVYGFGLLLCLLAVVAIGYMLNLGSQTGRIEERLGHRRVMILGYAVLAILCALGLVLDVRAVVEIFRRQA